MLDKEEDEPGTVPAVACSHGLLLDRKACWRIGESHDVPKIGGKHSEQSNC